MTTEDSFSWVVDGHVVVSVEDILWLFPPTEVWLLAMKESSNVELQDKHRARWLARTSENQSDYIEIQYADGAKDVTAWVGTPNVQRHDKMHTRSLAELLYVVIEWYKRNQVTTSIGQTMCYTIGCLFRESVL